MRIYEVNTVVWLAELSERYGRPITLDGVPDVDWDALAPYRFDAVWLMGVWRRSPVAATIARQTRGVVAECARVLPGFEKTRDMIASAYSISAYEADPAVGGEAGIAAARRALGTRGLKL